MAEQSSPKTGKNYERFIQRLHWPTTLGLAKQETQNKFHSHTSL